MFDMRALNGLIGEAPKVLHALATQSRDEKGVPTFIVIAMIRNSEPKARCALCESETSVHDAAKSLRDTLMRFGISWDGSFRFCTPEELKRLPGEAQAPQPTGPIIAS